MIQNLILTLLILSGCYCDYDENQPDSWNRSIKKYNDSLDQLIAKVK